jgi:hypothetical protein
MAGILGDSRTPENPGGKRFTSTRSCPGIGEQVE